MGGDVLYNQQLITFLEDLWGDGFLSPGGPDEVMRVIEGVDLSGKHVLDIGSGSGACSILLVELGGAGQVTGIDVEDPVCATARARVAEAGLSDKIEIQKVMPGPFPFGDESFDIVFSKDSIIHIPDKETMALEAFRVLRPGGRFAASDWLISHDNDPSPEMAHYIAEEGLDFGMASPDRYRAAMTDAGFQDVELVNRNPWYAKTSADELAELSGPNKAAWQDKHGAEFIDHQIEIWRTMQPVLQSGEHCPHHIRGTKPE